jgi:acetyl-CoA carboxylase biotin carboxyl carrier protein
VVDFDQLRAILSLVREHELSEFEIEQDGLHLKIRKGAPSVQSVPATSHPNQASSPDGAGAATLQPAPRSRLEPGEGESDVELAVVKSPIVGTFYRSAEPGAQAFVEVGTSVKKGQVLCIIEAMKLMNEIDSEYDGEIAAVYVENGQTVQYGERLFAIKTR